MYLTEVSPQIAVFAYRERGWRADDGPWFVWYCSWSDSVEKTPESGNFLVGQELPHPSKPQSFPCLAESALFQPGMSAIGYSTGEPE